MSLKFKTETSGFTPLIIIVNNAEDLQPLYTASVMAFEESISGGCVEAIAASIRDAVKAHAEKFGIELEVSA